MGKTFTVHHTRDIEVEEGWGVHVTPIFEHEDDEPEYGRVSKIIVEVVRIAADEIVYTYGGMPCVRTNEGGTPLHVPVENFAHVDDITHDDTHDLRTRWFATEDAARGHARHTEERFANPSPWESFVDLG